MKKKILSKTIRTAALSLAVLFGLSGTMNAQAAWVSSNGGWWNTTENSVGYSVGWDLIGGNWYHFDQAGWMETGWILDQGRWYYCKPSGAMSVNQWIGNYYVTENGEMAVNTWTPDGFYVGYDGAWISGQTKPTNQELYKNAVKDAMTVEKEEVFPVVAIKQESDMVTWNEKGQVLLLSWTKYPDSYVPGKDVKLSWGEVWTFTDKEMKKWYEKNKNKVQDWNLRLEQLIGLPEGKGYTHVTGMWVNPEDIVRPAYEYDIRKSIMKPAFEDLNAVDKEFHTWFDNNILWSYYHSAYPWTRLGYTYDWADNGSEYGLSEFIVKKNSDVSVEFTYTTEEFLNTMN